MDAIRFKIGEKTYELDIEDLTFDEWEEFERVVGAALEDTSRMRAMRGFIYLAARREDPTITFEDLGDVRPARIDDQVAEPAATDEDADERPPSVGGAPESVNGSSGSADAEHAPTDEETIHASSGAQ